MEEFKVGTQRKVFAVPQSVPEAPAAEASREADFAGSSEFSGAGRVPGFTVVDVDTQAVQGFSREYTPAFNTVDCVADIDMLLRYMVSVERKNNVTMSFQAYGVDPIVFNKAVPADRPDDNPACVMIPVEGKELSADYQGEVYEMIDVDGALYLSCMSESLNQEYLHQVIAEATEEVFTHGKYIYTLIGPRPLAQIDGKQSFIETLKLNSYELSILLSYMSQMDGVSVMHGEYGGRSAIMFTKE